MHTRTSSMQFFSGVLHLFIYLPHSVATPRLLILYLVYMLLLEQIAQCVLYLQPQFFWYVDSSVSFCLFCQNFSEVLYSWLPNVSPTASRFWEAFPSGMRAVILFVHTSSSWISYPGSCSSPAKTASSSCSPGNGHPCFSFIFYVNDKLTSKRSHCRFEN